jgi:hypothetical protein
LYEYYTKDLVLPEEKIPADIAQGSREPSRFLPYQSFFTETAIARIRAHPALYVKEQLVGTIRNAFVSDISQIHYYGHDRLLPFAYNPESRINLHELLLSGSFSGFLRALFSVHVLPKLLWIALLGLVYACACAGLVAAWLDDRKKFLSYLLFGALYGYLLVASGPFVDAKYRLPALLLVVVVALYGVHAIATKRFLRARRK